MNRLRIDLNADLGEGMPWDAAVLESVTSANVSCGAHAGDPAIISETLERARDRGVIVGAHPSYPDREHFGRRPQALSSAEVERLILDQVSALETLAAPLGVSVRYLKPHGALYNQAQAEPAIAQGVVSAAKTLGLPLLGLVRGQVRTEAVSAGVRFVAEGFPDRRLGPDGRLVDRSQPDAVLHDWSSVRENLATLLDWQDIETLCLHGDNPAAVELARRIRRHLEESGLRVLSFVERG